MNITCMVCCELIDDPTIGLISKCGHLFHSHCFQRWLQQSKTCPQCRTKCNEKTVFKVYFNVAENTGKIHSEEDPIVLKSKYDSVLLRNKMLETVLKKNEEDSEKQKEIHKKLRFEIKELGEKISGNNAIVIALKEKISYFSSKAKETDRLSNEVLMLKNKLRDLEMVSTILNGTKSQVEETIRNETDINSLALLSATLKNTLLKVEEKKREKENQLKASKSLIIEHRKEIFKLSQENNDLKEKLERNAENWKIEKDCLKNKIVALNEVNQTETTPKPLNDSLKRIIEESPVPLRFTQSEKNVCRKCKQEYLKSNKKTEDTLNDSLNYLDLKTDDFGLNSISNLVNVKYAKPNFKPIVKPKLTQEKPIILSSDVHYDGLGGHEKPDLFPTPKSKSLKRPNSSYILSSSKFKKCNPLIFKK